MERQSFWMIKGNYTTPFCVSNIFPSWRISFTISCNTTCVYKYLLKHRDIHSTLDKIIVNIFSINLLSLIKISQLLK